MAEVGDRVAVTSKAAVRSGVVTAVTGSLLRVRWDTGEETTFAPAAGALTVIAPARAKPPNNKRGSKHDPATNTTVSAKKTTAKKKR